MKAQRFGLVAVVLAAGSVSVALAVDKKEEGGDTASLNRAVDRGIAFLKSRQDANGSWDSQKSPGITGIVLTGLLRTHKVSADDPAAARALQYVESLVNAEAGHIAGKDPKPQLKNYVTSVNVMALVEANQANKYTKVIGDASQFLKKLQWDEGEGKNPSDDYYGGFGYDSHNRPDLSNSQLALDALTAAGIAKDDPALKRALVFVSRCQNLKGEHNDQPWAGKINDGSFIYSAANGGDSKVEGSSKEHGLFGYGSMTYAGIKSMIYCGLTKEDPRVQKAYEWIQQHYTVEANPGMTPAQSQRGLYYYYHTMAKCLDALGVDEVVDSQGVHHNWRADLIQALVKRQQEDGSWVNSLDAWMEKDAALVTGYALLTLSYCQKK